MRYTTILKKNNGDAIFPEYFLIVRFKVYVPNHGWEAAIHLGNISQGCLFSLSLSHIIPISESWLICILQLHFPSKDSTILSEIRFDTTKNEGLAYGCSKEFVSKVSSNVQTLTKPPRLHLVCRWIKTFFKLFKVKFRNQNWNRPALVTFCKKSLSKLHDWKDFCL